MISVCMGTYNGAIYIREQLQTILDQTVKPDEVILCDDGSTDSTREMIVGFIEEHQLQDKWKLYCNEQNKGYPGNFYYAMSLCSGDYIFLADQDDIWDPAKIERMISCMKKSTHIKVLSCKFGLIDNDGTEIHSVMAPTRTGQTGDLRKVSISDVFYKCEWPGMVMAYDGHWYKALLQSRKDNTEYTAPHSVPHDFLLCAWAAETGGFYQLDEQLALHRRHNNNAGQEEHRISRLLNRHRKLKEITKYLCILQEFSAQQLMRTQEGIDALACKEAVMTDRYEALLKGSFFGVLKNVWKHRTDTRIVTAVCDLIIVLKDR